MLFNLLTSATSESGSEAVAAGGCNDPVTIIMWVVLLAVFVLLFVFNGRARKKQQKELQDKLDSLKVGDRVKTIGLICGIVVAVYPEENTFVLETGKDNHGTFIKFDKSAIYQISSKKKDETTTTEDPATTTTTTTTEDSTPKTTEQKQ